MCRFTYYLMRDNYIVFYSLAQCFSIDDRGGAKLSPFSLEIKILKNHPK